MTEQRDDPRNVIDVYAYWKEDAIKADLRKKHNNFSVLITNKFNDFNIGSVIRNANAFCAKEVIIYGSKQYDKRGTVGAHLYTDIRHLRYTDELVSITNEDSVIIGVDNLDGSVPVENFEWPNKHVVLALGQETTGLTQEIIDLCENMVYISQYGSVRSLNVGCASAIAMYDYCRKMVR